MATVSIVSALAVLRLRHSAGLEAAVCGRLGALLRNEPEGVHAQVIATSLWALAVSRDLDAVAAELSLQLAYEAAARWGSFNQCELCQLWQAQQELGGEVTAALGRSPGLQAAAVEAARAQTKANSRSGEEELRPTDTQQRKQVAAALRWLQRQGPSEPVRALQSPPEPARARQSPPEPARALQSLQRPMQILSKAEL